MSKKQQVKQTLIKVKRVLKKCEFPLCPAKSSLVSKFGLCLKHNDMFQFYVWIRRVETTMHQQEVQDKHLWTP